MKRYVFLLSGLIAASILTMMVLAVIGFEACFPCELLRYQESKVESVSDVDTVFLGDSTIGYALDAKLFSELSGKKTVNLALQGWNYGFAGAYVLLSELLDHAQPKTVVIALSPQTMAFSIDELKGKPIEGFVQAARHRPLTLFSAGRNISWHITQHLAPKLFDRQYLINGIEVLGGQRPSTPEFFRELDYLEEVRPSLDPITMRNVTIQSTASHDYDVFIAKIASLCKERGMVCLYFNGTMLESMFVNHHALFRKVANVVQGSGIKVIREEPIGIADADIGNTLNHVRWDLRPVYTRKIYNLLAQELR